MTIHARYKFIEVRIIGEKEPIIFDMKAKQTTNIEVRKIVSEMVADRYGKDQQHYWVGWF